MAFLSCPLSQNDVDVEGSSSASGKENGRVLDIWRRTVATVRKKRANVALSMVFQVQQEVMYLFRPEERRIGNCITQAVVCKPPKVLLLEMTVVIILVQTWWEPLKHCFHLIPPFDEVSVKPTEQPKGIHWIKFSLSTWSCLFVRIS